MTVWEWVLGAAEGGRGGGGRSKEEGSKDGGKSKEVGGGDGYISGSWGGGGLWCQMRRCEEAERRRCDAGPEQGPKPLHDDKGFPDHATWYRPGSPKKVATPISPFFGDRRRRKWLGGKEDEED